MASHVTIKAIEPSTIHQIHSGQVIVDLSSVAKELVENSIDAGATSIEVRFKNQGLDSIEVQDNGLGISPENYETIALKHYTSKLSTYDDLATLHTFGFRGEALSSLCALSTCIIVTCTQRQAPKATKLEFSTSGKLEKTSVISGQTGTTVVVENLFHNLPVRRRELERNIKRDWGKVISLLNQYACVQTGLKFTVSQQPTKGKRMVLFSTKGNATTRENIINVFGIKTVSALVPLDLRLELQQSTNKASQKVATRNDGTNVVFVRGHVSRPTHGEGRQTPDRQMLYVNGRPCSLPQFAKVFNEVYRSHNSSQSPFIFADFQLDTALYDVNVSPDKRTILLHDQGRMLDQMRESLLELFEKQNVDIPVAHASTVLKQTPFKKLSMHRAGSLSAVSIASAVSSRSVPGAIHGALVPTGSRRSSEPQAVGMDENVAEGARSDAEKEGGEAEAGRDDVHGSKPLGRANKCTKMAISETGDSRPRGHVSTTKCMHKKHHIFVRANGEGQDRRSSSSISLQAAASNGASEVELEKTTALSVERPDRRLQQVMSSTDGPDASELNDTAHIASPAEAASSDDASGTKLAEQPIPAIPRLSQPSLSSVIGSRISRPLKPVTQEIATITIGGHTVKNLLGSPPKRSRSSGSDSLSAARKLGKASVLLPSFGSQLTQMFSASSTGPTSTISGDLRAERIVLGQIEVEKAQGGGDYDRAVCSQMETDGEKDQNQGSQPEEKSRRDGLFVTNGETPPFSDSEEAEDAAANHNGASGGIDRSARPQDAELAEHTNADDAADPALGDDAEEGDYVDEDAKKALEERKVQEMIKAAETKRSESKEDAQKRSEAFAKGRVRQKRKKATHNLLQRMRIDEATVRRQVEQWKATLPPTVQNGSAAAKPDRLDAHDAEDKLSLKMAKSDFGRMRIVGQFNLGFILAVREACSASTDKHDVAAADAHDDDELFIIDQHASDEKYNFERLQSTTVLQSQRLVQPLPLQLTAVEEEILLENVTALQANGFAIQVDTSGAQPVGTRCQLLSLPHSRETTFGLPDLEELIFLLGDNPPGSATTVPRPSKVRKMLAMRACRSSIMIGRALSGAQMRRVVRNMGVMDKPWNCPHGRPTMRHLCGLSGWAESGWKEGDDDDGNGEIDWTAWLRG